ncbi:MAG: helix-turn-helix transcriptional regulator [Clostridia bacterium]|nr:helix-turn-helix transcriptional regulator [Clostridia bacterium]
MSDLLKQTFGQILYKKRIELKYSQEAMAKKCCISVRQYIDLEHGLRLPTFQTFVNITIILEINYDAFISLLIKQGYNVLDKSGVA